MTDSAAISAIGLRKALGGKTVLDGVDLHAAEGSVLALLGANGAGKTTAVRILSTLLRPDAGTARIAGHDLATAPEAVRAAIGLTGQFAALDGLLTAEENLFLMADLHHLPKREGRRRAAHLLERFELTGRARETAATFSGGLRRRLDLAMTLVGEPRVIFLDEPTTGLDPRSRHTLWDIIRDLVADGVTILLTTQYLDEADRLADRVAVLDGGRIVAEGTPAELKRRIPGGHVLLRLPDERALASAGALFPASVPDSDALTLRVPGDGDIAMLRAVIDALNGASLEPDSLTVHTPDLDDVFFALTGNATLETSR
ncbi:ABC-2 type transport system ATP-binding protein [Actinocorallia herbida]|uniref:ABC-2 type transport system ATP-binding protein n=1 Tax=Actinocorallia herbida TaxID=58109 RepID=A0A3N1CNX2_9ACTN|nr:ATP-binding cassette domain-containing protein [Actinocorallia herbida]ROO83029.1 ABC-2 type transport system ATP-binding protein [Actinocorallia herbida]